MSRYRKSMKDALREVRGIIKEDTTSSYPPKEINKKKHAAYKDPKRGEHEIIKKETNDPTIDDIAKGLKLDKKLVKKIMGEVFDYDEKVLDENVSQQIKTLKTIMAPMRGAKISIDGAKKLMDIMDKFDKKEDLIDLFKADIPFVSQSAAARLISKFRMSGAEVNKLREEVELKELFGISSTAYHRNNTMKFLDKMGIKHEPTGRNGLIIKGVPKDKQQGLLNKIRKEVGMYDIATKDEEVELDENFEGKFKTGDMIKAYDFEPMKGRPDRFIKGQITGTKTVRGMKYFTVDVRQDTAPLTGGKSRVGQTILVPVNLGTYDSSLDYKNRIVKESLDENQWFDLDENQYAYTVVHVKHGKEVVKANSSYEAAKKYAQMKGLKSTAGVDAHLMEETINEFTKKDFDKNEDENKHTENGVELVNRFGTSAEKKQMAGIAYRHTVQNSITIRDQRARDKMINKYVSKLESVNIDEKKHFSSQQIKQAYGIANDKRYKGGNLAGAVAAIEKIANGLSLHPDVLKVLQRTHEEVELSLAVESLFVSESSPNTATKNALAKLANQGGMDKRTYQKANMMYGRGDEPLSIRVKSLRKFIYDLDTEPREEIMKAINDNDKAFFKKMYPKAKPGDYLSSISYQHRNEDFEHQGAREVVERLTGMKLSEISAKADKSLTKKAKATDIPKPILKKVYKRGMAAFGSGRRTGMNQQGWAHARVNSFIDKKPGTWGGADKDLAKKAKAAKKEEKKK